MINTIRNNGGNRALVCYLYSDNFVDTPIHYLDAFSQRIDNVLNTVNATRTGGGVCTNEINGTRTVDIKLLNGDWTRSLKIGGCSGGLLAGVYFFEEQELEPEILVENEEPIDDEIQDDATEVEEQEQVSVPQLIYDELRSAFPDGKSGASVFVVNPEQNDFDFVVE